MLRRGKGIIYKMPTLKQKNQKKSKKKTGTKNKGNE